jgi:large-conductance mechanosensitive channel
MNLKRLMFFLLIAFAIFFVIKSPNEAAKLVKESGQSAGEWLSTAADSFSTFLKSLI